MLIRIRIAAKKACLAASIVATLLSFKRGTRGTPDCYLVPCDTRLPIPVRDSGDYLNSLRRVKSGSPTGVIITPKPHFFRHPLVREAQKVSTRQPLLRA
jgi:hypothetical protein